MHERYEDPDLKKVWNDTRKFAEWLRVEVAVLEARERLGQIPAGTAARVRERTFVDDHVAELINRRDKAIKHDLQAFVEIVWLQLILHQEDKDFWDTMQQWQLEAEAAKPNGLTPEQRFQQMIDAALGTSCAEAELVHARMTSYDTQEPAMGLLLREAGAAIDRRIAAFDAILVERIRKHRMDLQIGRTHVQHAQPITFGVKLLNYLEAIRSCRRRVATAVQETGVMKLSGAVGMFTLDPEVEDAVGKLLGLEPVISTQIVGLDRKANLLNALALLGSVLEKIATDLHDLTKPEIREVQEPFDEKGQTGSSAMPHKKNPILLEQCKGLPRTVRGYALAALENVATLHERDISHSSVERIVIADAFHAVGHVLRRLGGVIKKMRVFPERMCANLELEHRTYASQEVSVFLRDRGVAAKTAYRIVQEAAFQSMEHGIPFRDSLLCWDEVRDLVERDAADRAVFEERFEPRWWLRHVDAIYRRFDARWTKLGYAPVLEG